MLGKNSYLGLSAGAVLAALALGAASLSSFATIAPQAQAGFASPAVTRIAGNQATSPKPAATQSTKPLWTELTPAQRQALGPLSGTWNTISEAQKRKWLAMSQNYPRMSGAEQDKLHSRMTDWASLSPQQRTQARLNFGETQQLSPDDKKAKWEAYQALPPEEKRKFQAGAAKPPATAAAVKPIAPEKLATIPKPPHRPEAKTPRIAVAPNQVDHNTLLPQHAPARGARQVN